MLLLIMQSLTMSCTADPLEPFRWQHRTLMVFTPADQLTSLQAQLEAFEAEVIDRHMLWFLIADETLTSNYENPLDSDFADQITQRYRNGEADQLEVVLVGKDGSVKYRADQLAPQAVFATIDRMPMRRAEMNR